VYKHANRIPEGFQAIEDALSEAEKTSETSCLSGIHRINGKLHHAARQPEREAIHTAIEIARQQETTWSELRVTTDLARNVSETIEAAEALRLLRTVIDKFPRSATYRTCKTG
jgi:hypothetical protein